MLTIKNFKTAFNSLLRAKGYVFTIVLTLGITLGALVAMFNLNYQLLAAPLPYPDQDKLYIVKGNAYKNGQLAFSDLNSYPALVDSYKDKESYFLQKALINVDQDIIRSLPDTPQINTSFITPEYLQLLNTPMALGRSFNSSEGLEAHIPVAVISYYTWLHVFKLDPTILNKTLQLGEVSFNIVGVTAKQFIEPQFEGVGRVTDVWLPWDYSASGEEIQHSWTRLKSGQHLVVKLKPDAQPDKLEEILTKKLNSRFEAERSNDSFFRDLTINFNLISYQQAILGDITGRILLLLTGALALLLIAVVNITNLMLARVSNQQRNMAIQAALGAQKFHLFNGLLAEILIVIFFSAGLALSVSLIGIQLLKRFAHQQLPRVAELHLSWPSFLFTLVSGLLLAFIFAFLVNRQVNYRRLNNLLNASGKGTGVQISAKVRGLLVLSQVVCTAILLAASVQILQQSVQHIRQPLGFSTEDVYRVSLNMGAQASSSYDERKNNLLAIANDLRTHPKISNLSIASDDPINSVGLYDYLSATPDYQQREKTLLAFIDQQYVNILNMTLIAGRNFTADEFKLASQSIIVNDTFARKLQSDGQVLNKRFYWQSGGTGKEVYQVVGILHDLSLPNAKEEPRMFIPQVPDHNVQLLLQLKPYQKITKQELNELLARINGQYKVVEITAMTYSHQLLLAQDILSASLTAALTVLALGLAAIGIYGVLSYSVQLRRFELGIRMAIGARPNTVFWQILKDNLMPVIGGLCIALFVLICLWIWLPQSNYSAHTSSLGWLLPPILILSLTAVASLLSVWEIIRKPASEILRGD